MIPKYQLIYQDIKRKIKNNLYKPNSFLPSESELTKEYHCSRNTLRNALSILSTEGFIQPIQGKGVRVIPFTEPQHNKFLLHGVDDFQEKLEMDDIELKKFVSVFSELYVTDEINEFTKFPLKSPIYYVERLRYMDNIPVIIHRSYYRQDYVKGLTKSIAEKSIYDYIQNDLKNKIGITKRTIFVEKASENDMNLLSLEDYDCVVVVVNRTFDSEGVIFEFTESRHNPAYFIYSD